MKILFFAWFIKGRSGSVIAEEMIKQGHDVFRIAIDNQDKSVLAPHELYLKDFLSKEDYHEFIARRMKYDVSKILNIIDFKPDCIYIYQTSPNYNLINCNIPKFYNHHEILLPCIPSGNLDIIFTGFHGCKEQLTKIYYDRLYNIPFVRTHFPISDIYNPELNANNRTIFCGFKGAFVASNPDNDPAMEGIYNNRRRFLEYGKKECGIYVEGFNINPNQHEQLIYFLKKCNLALNISGCIGDWGFNNERMLLAAMCGCVVLHYWYPTIEQDGYIDFETALIFHNERELKERIEWAKSNPIKLEEIRINGYEMVKKRYNLSKIVGEQLSAMNNYIDSLSDPTFQPIERLNYNSIIKIKQFEKEWINWFNEYQKDPNICRKEPKLEEFKYTKET